MDNLNIIEANKPVESITNFDNKIYIHELKLDDTKFKFYIEISYKSIKFKLQKDNEISNKYYVKKYELQQLQELLELPQSKYNSIDKLYAYIEKALNKNRILLKYEKKIYFLIIQSYIDEELNEHKIELIEEKMKDPFNDCNFLNIINNRFKLLEDQLFLLSKENSKMKENINKKDKEIEILNDKLKFFEEKIEKLNKNESTIFNDNNTKEISISKNDIKKLKTIEDNDILNEYYHFKIFFELKDEIRKIILDNKICKKISNEYGIYEGELKNGKREGKGIYKDKDGNIYEGEWKNDIPEGKGILKCINNDIFEGEWKNGLKNGKGVYKWNNGDIYRGDYKNDIRYGKGMIRFKNGNTYEGDWENDKANGYGIITIKNVKVYEGEFKDDKKCGKGIYRYEKGIYEGEWKDSKRNGRGKMIYFNGKIEDGIWENDIFKTMTN